MKTKKVINFPQKMPISKTFLANLTELQKLMVLQIDKPVTKEKYLKDMRDLMDICLAMVETCEGFELELVNASKIIGAQSEYMRVSDIILAEYKKAFYAMKTKTK